MAGLEAVAGDVVTSLVTGVLEKAISYGHELQGASSELKTAVNGLQMKLEAIKDILPNRKQQPVWMAALKDTVYEADAVLDEIEYERLKRQVKKFNFPSVFNKRSFLLRVREIQTKLVDSLNTASTVENLRKKLKDSTAVQVGSSSNPRETTSLPDSKQLIGREYVRDGIINWLLDNSTKPIETLGNSSTAPYPNINEDIPVLSIYGMGGMGKTTLAQHIFNAEDVKSRFELTVWVYVSENFDIMKIMKEILGSARSRSSGTGITRQDSKRKSSSRDPDSLQFLEQELIQKLTGMRFLMVLDDVWNDKKEAWDKLRKCFQCGKQGSKIMVTCRSEKVAKVMATPNTKPMRLDGLSRDDFWVLFRKYAIGEQVISTEKSQEYEQVGRKIAQKLQGSPLAAKTVGRILQSKLEIEHWTQVLESELWDIEQSDCEIMPALLLSYEHLPDHLKPCFTDLSLLPKGWSFLNIFVIMRWIAHGFVQRLNYRKSLIDVGMEYMNELLHRSLFEKVEQEASMIYMHDLIHDMARKVSKDESFLIKDNNFAHIPQRVRHLSIYPDDFHIDWMKIMSQLNIEYLHSLTIDGRDNKSIHSKNKDFMSFIDKILTEGKNLKLLRLVRVGIKEVPSKISNLKLLRMLTLCGNPIRTLPKSIACLYHLQSLDVSYCSKLEILPKEMTSLLNLTHFDGDYSLLDTSCFRKLKSTVQLDFNVLCAQDHNIKELSGLDYIRQLSIQGLENVNSKEEAMEANLKGKNYLEILVMIWSLEAPSSIRTSNDEEVIEGLQPSPQLKYLRIRNYGGVRCPSWIASDDLPNLRVVEFDNCFALKEIFTSERIPESIQELELVKCEQLQGTPLLKNDNFFSQNLNTLYIMKCGEFGNCLQWKHFVGLKFLNVLFLGGCASIEYLPTEELQSLKKLAMSECKMLSSKKGMGDLQALTSLVDLLIRKCDHFMKGLVEADGATLPSSLQMLLLNYYPGELLFSNVFVHSLELYDSEKLQSLPIEVLLFVKTLKIGYCPNLCPPNGQLELMAGSNIKHFHMCPTSVDNLKEWLGFLKSSKLSTLEIKDIVVELEPSFVDELGGLLADLQSLNYLYLKDLKGLRSVPGTLSKHPSLGYLEISKCPDIKSLSGSMFPDSMVLEIIDCPNLTKRGLPEKEFIEHTLTKYIIKHTTRSAAKPLPWHK